ncbi:hypothetical protein E5676_scaffold3344G00040 [Cucumis melo var. makuwa]|uniref:Uncharacterized protein n=1 Tax=Cucumis melo var. makuwa TaxID=1194695 RepID=A0A5D3E2M0_CUCMM|nr:hypothetical protein E5676_scaffold3344G00040 [Cucumis melo var. makuwa]
MCVRIVNVHVSCSSHGNAQLAAFFIDPRAKGSTEMRGFKLPNHQVAFYTTGVEAWVRRYVVTTGSRRRGYGEALAAPPHYYQLTGKEGDARTLKSKHWSSEAYALL